jgi:hypothetical protein
VKELLGDDKPEFIGLAERDGTRVATDPTQGGRCLSAVWRQPGLNEEEERFFKQDL